MINEIELLKVFFLGIVTGACIMGWVFILATYKRDKMIRQGRYVIVDGTKIKQQGVKCNDNNEGN